MPARKTDDGYRYDGLDRVDDYWMETWQGRLQHVSGKQ